MASLRLLPKNLLRLSPQIRRKPERRRKTPTLTLTTNAQTSPLLRLCNKLQGLIFNLKLYEVIYFKKRRGLKEERKGKRDTKKTFLLFASFSLERDTLMGSKFSAKGRWWFGKLYVGASFVLVKISTPSLPLQREYGLILLFLLFPLSVVCLHQTKSWQLPHTFLFIQPQRCDQFNQAPLCDIGL